MLLYIEKEEYLHAAIAVKLENDTMNSDIYARYLCSPYIMELALNRRKKNEANHLDWLITANLSWLNFHIIQ